MVTISLKTQTQNTVAKYKEKYIYICIDTYVHIHARYIHNRSNRFWKLDYESGSNYV